MLIECSCAVCHGPLYYAATGTKGSGKGGVSPATCSDNCRQVWHKRILKGIRPVCKRYYNLRTVNAYRQQLHADVAALARWMEAHGIKPDDQDAETLEADRLRFTWTRKYRLAPLQVTRRYRVKVGSPRRKEVLMRASRILARA